MVIIVVRADFLIQITHCVLLQAIFVLQQQLKELLALLVRQQTMEPHALHVLQTNSAYLEPQQHHALLDGLQLDLSDNA